jgi:hypothetical protein
MLLFNDAVSIKTLWDATLMQYKTYQSGPDDSRRAGKNERKDSVHKDTLIQLLLTVES